MLKDLTLYEPNKYPVQSDDLKYDGQRLLIPSYWTDTILSVLSAVDGLDIDGEDREDIVHLTQFLREVKAKKDEKNSQLNERQTLRHDDVIAKSEIYDEKTNFGPAAFTDSGYSRTVTPQLKIRQWISNTDKNNCEMFTKYINSKKIP